MTKIRQRKYLLAIAALVLVFAGCKGESPTAPTSTTPGGGTGGVTPPTSATINLSVSNPTPLVDSTTVVTASVTVDNAPAPNGTAVQFQTTLGTFTDANAAATIRTTTGGVATATLTSSSAGTATVTVTVNNVSKSTQVTFTLKPTTPNPPDTTPTISSVTPTTGRPAGGEIITINGKNLVTPVRVLFDYGTGSPKEAQVISASSTQIQAITPPVDLGTGQTKDATIIVLSNAGTAGEVRITGPKFTYQAEVLTPKITTLSPTSGPIDGGTRVTIFGEGFQAPIQVFFGSAEAQVINITFYQITVMSPTGSATAPAGSGSVTGPVDVKIININSATTVTATGAFRYTPKMVVTAMGPTEGPFTGGTRVTIDGNGFNDPVAVVIGGVAATPIKVSGTQIIAITSGVAVTGCGDVTGQSSVTNVDNGDTAQAPAFIYRVPKPLIVSVTPNPTTPGSTIQVVVAGAYGIPRLKIGDTALSLSNATSDPTTGLTTLTAVVPTSLTLGTASCGGITTAVPTAFDVVYASATTGCTDTLSKGLVINPVGYGSPILSVTPTSFTPFAAKFTPAACSTTGTPPVTTCTTPASITPSPAQPATLVNTGVGPLTIASVTNTCGTDFTITAPAAGTVLGQCETAAVNAVYNGPAITNPNGTTLASATTPNPTSTSCTVSILTSAGTKTLSLSGTTQ